MNKNNPPKHYLYSFGFALPMVLIVTSVLLVASTILLRNVVSVKASLDAQHYNLLAKQAAEAGVVRGMGCYKNGMTTWTELKPQDSCTGDSSSGSTEPAATTPPSVISSSYSTTPMPDISVSKPSGLVTGNLIICGITTSNGVIATPAGWVKIAEAPTAHSADTVVFAKVVDGSEPATLFFDETSGLSNQQVTHCLGIKDQADDYLHSTGVNANYTGSQPTANISTSINKTLLVGFQGYSGDQIITATPPANMTEYGDNMATWNWRHASVSAGTRETTVSETLTWDIGVSGTWTAVAIAIKPKPGTTGSTTEPSVDWWNNDWKVRQKLAFDTSGLPAKLNTTSKRVQAGTDDVEEYVSNGAIDITSSDLEMVDEGGTAKQEVGIRFAGMNIPAGATITKAYIQFTTDEADSSTTNVTIRGGAIDNAATFNTTAYNVSSRPKTTSSVAWSSIPSWPTIDEAGPNQRTPELKTIVQEIINRGGWTSGNALSFHITGGGERTARAFEVDSNKAALLYVEYTTASSAPENLLNFPVRVSLTPSNVDYTKIKSDGSDLRITDSDGTTLLPHEIEKWSHGGTSELWVRVPQLDASSTTDNIYVYYNNTKNPVSLLRDDYKRDTSQWWGYESGASVDQGRAKLPTNSSYSVYLASKQSFELTGSSTFFEMVQRPNLGNGSTEFGMTLEDSANTNNQFVTYVSGNSLVFREKVNGVNSNISMTYNAINHKWWRIREAGGIVYWETSPDSFNWTVQRQKTPAIPIGAMRMVFWTGHWNTETDPGAALVDNVNYPSTLVPENVWSNGYESVWHMNENPAGTTPQIKDSTSNNNHGTAQGAMPGTSSVAGQVGNSLAFDGTDDQITTTSPYNNPQNITVESWFKTAGTQNRKIVGFEILQTGVSNNHDRHIWAGSDGIVRAGAYDGTIDIASGAVARNNNIWHYAATTIDNTNDILKLYENGSQTGNAANSNAESMTGYWRIGGYQLNSAWASNAAGHFNGSIDEVRISNVVRTSTWIAAQQKSMSNSLITFGAKKSIDGTVLGLTAGTYTSDTIAKGERFMTTFAVSPPVVNSSGTVSLTAQGTVSILNSSGTVIKTYKQTVKRTSNPGFADTTLSKDRLIPDQENMFVLAPDNQLYGAGRNTYGELGDGTTINSSSPVKFQLPAGVTVKKATGNDYITLAVASDGNVYGVGINNTGQLGDGTTINRTIPVRFQLPAGKTAVAADTEDNGGNGFTWVLTSDGEIYGSGYNTNGQLGDGTKTTRLTPVKMQLPAGVSIKSMSSDGPGLVMLGTDNLVYVVGGNWDGQLGDGTETDRATPIKWALPAGLTAKKIFAADVGTYVLASDDQVYVSGTNPKGQLGDGTTIDKLSPIRYNLPAGVSAKDIDGDGDVIVVIGTNGKVYVSGWNLYGQLGDGTTIDRYTPQIFPLPSGVNAVMTGTSSFTVWVLGSDGQIYSSGANWSGELGDGTYTHRSSPVRFQLPSGVLGKAITSGTPNCFVLTTTNEVWSSGPNSRGQLGDGSTTNRLTPVKYQLPASSYNTVPLTITY